MTLNWRYVSFLLNDLGTFLLKIWLSFQLHIMVIYTYVFKNFFE